jgi:hypothetical protein
MNRLQKFVERDAYGEGAGRHAYVLQSSPSCAKRGHGMASGQSSVQDGHRTRLRRSSEGTFPPIEVVPALPVLFPLLESVARLQPVIVCAYDSQQTGGDARWAIMRSGWVQVGEPRRIDALG